jgi:hypothetical protein
MPEDKITPEEAGFEAIMTFNDAKLSIVPPFLQFVKEWLEENGYEGTGSVVTSGNPGFKIMAKRK